MWFTHQSRQLYFWSSKWNYIKCPFRRPSKRSKCRSSTRRWWQQWIPVSNYFSNIRTTIQLLRWCSIQRRHSCPSTKSTQSNQWSSKLWQNHKSWWIYPIKKLSTSRIRKNHPMENIIGDIKKFGIL